jgi:hypothetical protein
LANPVQEVAIALHGLKPHIGPLNHQPSLLHQPRKRCLDHGSGGAGKFMQVAVQSSILVIA